jgi:uncharacterized membrane protein
MAGKRNIPGNSKYLRIINGNQLPPPEVLQKYENIQPGLIRMLVRKSEIQMVRRFDIEQKALNSNNMKSFAGLIFGFLMGIFGMGGGFYLTLRGYNVIGIICTSSTLVSLVMAFVYGSQAKRNGNHDSSEILNKP